MPLSPGHISFAFRYLIGKTAYMTCYECMQVPLSASIISLCLFLKTLWRHLTHQIMSVLSNPFRDRCAASQRLNQSVRISTRTKPSSAAEVTKAMLVVVIRLVLSRSYYHWIIRRAPWLNGNNRLARSRRDTARVHVVLKCPSWRIWYSLTSKRYRCFLCNDCLPERTVSQRFTRRFWCKPDLCLCRPYCSALASQSLWQFSSQISRSWARETSNVNLSPCSFFRSLGLRFDVDDQIQQHRMRCS